VIDEGEEGDTFVLQDSFEFFYGLFDGMIAWLACDSSRC